MHSKVPDTEESVPKLVVIVDDHPLMRRGLADLIESEPNLKVCDQAATCAAGLKAIEARRPDLVIVDLELKGSSGLDLVKELLVRFPNIPALVLSMHSDPTYAERSLRAGARGYVSKQQLDETVLSAIRCVLGGGTFISEEFRTLFATKYIGGQTLAANSALDALSDRELQVFRFIGRGRTTRQIADILNLSVKTIESHREHIKKKLGLDSAAELAQRATQWVETGRIS